MTIFSTVYPVVGATHRIFPLSHNWREPLRESYEFRTDIITSGNGKEQRRAVRFEPRRSLELNCTYDAKGKWALDQFMVSGLPLPTILADERRVVEMTRQMDAEAISATVEADVATWLQIGMQVVIADGPRRETRIVASFSSTVIAFTEFNNTVFPVGSKIYPALIGRVQTQPQARRLTSLAGTISIQFDVDVASEPAPASGPGEMIGFREVLLRKPNWATAVNLTYDYPRNPVDYDFGRVAQFVPYDFATLSFKGEYVGRSVADTQTMINFFCRQRGQNREFLRPTFEHDMPFVTMSGFNIVMSGTAFAAAYADSSVHRRLVIRRNDGSLIHRQIDSIEGLAETDTSVIRLTEALPAENLSPATVEAVSWVFVSRFATDRLEIDWLTTTVSQFSLTTKSLENFDL